MPRIPRIFIKNPNAAYHLISRTALNGFVLGPPEKDHLLSLIRWLSSVFFVEVYGFCIMDNHFHLLCRMLPENLFPDHEVQRRIKLYYGDRRPFRKGDLLYWRSRLSDLSRYVQEIKQRFSLWFNKRHGRKGYFWADRFKSVVIETGEALLNCLAYIDLNPVRAGLVQRPEHYRWCSLAYHLGTGNQGGFLSTDLGVAAFTHKGYTERVALYQAFVYEKAGLERGTGAKKRLSGVEVFRQRIRHFSEGLIIGTQEFVRRGLEQVRELLGLKRKRPPRELKPLPGLYA